MEAPQRFHLLHDWKERSRQKTLKKIRGGSTAPPAGHFGCCGHVAQPTFVVVYLVPVAVDHVRLQKVQEGARDEEAVGEGKVFDVARVQCEGVGWRGDGAQAHQLADDVPHPHT